MTKQAKSLKRITCILVLASAGLLPLAAHAIRDKDDDWFPGKNLEEVRKQFAGRAHNPEHGSVRIGRLTAAVVAKAPPSPIPFDDRRSLFVTDLRSTEQISFTEVVEQLVRQSGDKTLTKEALYKQWWDSNNVKPGVTGGPHCDDDAPIDPAGDTTSFTAVSQKNGFNYRCPRVEGQLANDDPFKNANSDQGYTAIAFSNRFDLIDDEKHPTDCGEHRVVFARNSGMANALVRNLIIFEARVPNPHPNEPGLKGCKDIVDFWYGLSADIGPDKRGKLLHDFFMKGDLGHGKKLPAPVVSVANYTFGAGQIRANQFINLVGGAPKPVDWSLREYKTFKQGGHLSIVADSTKTNPGEQLFQPGTTDTRIEALESAIIGQFDSLAGANADTANDPNALLNSIGASLAGEGVNSFESDESPRDDNGDIAGAGRFDATSGLGKAIQAALDSLPAGAPAKGLTADNVVHRLRTQTCSGCHHFSVGDSALGGGAPAWPATLGAPAGVTPAIGFVQESERDIEISPEGGVRWQISPVVKTLITHRDVFMKCALGLIVNCAKE